MNPFNWALFLGCCVIGACVVAAGFVVAHALPATAYVPRDFSVSVSDVSAFDDYLSPHEAAAF